MATIIMSYDICAPAAVKFKPLILERTKVDDHMSEKNALKSQYITMFSKTINLSPA